MSNIEKFTGSTTNGNESGFKRGVTVPPNAVNLAWVKTPKLNPEANMIVVDTSAIISENIDNYKSGIYFANLIGKLEDIDGNQVITEEYPAISDEFNITGDISNIDLNSELPFPYVHVSRFFHVDKAGLIPGPILTNYDSPLIKVVDKDGNIYADNNGNLKFIVKIIPTYQPWPGSAAINTSVVNPSQSYTAYRVYVFIDTNTNDSLYVKYNKVEINDIDGTLINRSINYKEVLNPQPYFENRPEESEVADPVNSEKKWYATKSISLKEKLLGLPVSNKKGYEVVVPQKAIPDPRLFQLFDWRVVCTFTQNYNVGTDSSLPIKCGVVVTDNLPTSNVAQVFNIIGKQPINVLDLSFANPIKNLKDTKDPYSTYTKDEDSYWYVNFDTITDEQLSSFDILVWSPPSPEFDFSNYSGRIQYFTNTLGRILLIDTDSYTVPIGLPMRTTASTIVETGEPTSASIIGANYALPSNSKPPADVSTWMPQLFLGLMVEVTNSTPPPPPLSGQSNGWQVGTPSDSSLKYLQYIASDGKKYYKRNNLFNAHAILNNQKASNFILANQFSGTKDRLRTSSTTNWNPPIFEGIASDFPNPPPPTGSQWISNMPSSDYLSYEDNTNSHIVWYLPLSTDSINSNNSINPIINSYALVNPAISFSGDIIKIVDGIQSWFPGSYPNITTGSLKSIGTNVTGGGIHPITLTTQSGATVSGANYNYPKNPMIMSSTGQPTSTSAGQYQPPSGVVAIDSTDNGATYNVSTSFLDATSLNGWTINTSEPISYFQTAYGVNGGKVQYLLDIPIEANTIVSGQLATLTTENFTNSITITTTNYQQTKHSDIKNTSLTNTSGTPLYGTNTPVTIDIPQLPTNAVLSQIIINAYIPYNYITSSLTNNFTCRVVAPGGAVGTGFTASAESSLLTAGVINLVCSIHNGSSLDLSKSFTLFFETNNGIYTKDATLTATMVYYTTDDSANITTQIINGTVNVPASAQIPFLSTVPLVVEYGKVLVSTMGIPQSVCFGIPGAAKLLYNMALFATANKTLSTYSNQSYSSSFTLSSKWQGSWVINITDNPNVLSDAEKALYEFTYLPTNAATPEVVGQRKLSNFTNEQLILQSLTDNIGNSNDPVFQNEQSLLKAMQGANKTYTFEVTNSLVEIDEQKYGSNPSAVPYAWTRAYTPALTIPSHIKTYAIRETSVKGSYKNATFINRTYPEEPYMAQVRAYLDSDNTGSINTNWTATGHATVTYDTTFWTPPKEIQELVTTTQSVEVILNGKDNGLPSGSSLGNYYQEYHLPYTGVSVPGTIQTSQDDNYYSDMTSPCWPFMGLTGLYAPNIPIDSIGCQFIQDALNNFHNLGFFNMSGGNLAVDGIYGPLTTRAIYDFQYHYQLISSDSCPGIADAETLAVIGTQVLRSGIDGQNYTDSSDFHYIYRYPWQTIQYANVSDGDTNTQFRKRSNAFNGPGFTWDILVVSFDQVYNMHGITITPWCEGTSATTVIAGIDAHIANTYAGLIGPYNPENMMLKNLGIRSGDNQPVYIPFNPVQANQIYVWIGQDTASYSYENIGTHNVYDINGKFYCTTGQETTQSFGVRDITASATIQKQVAAWETVTIPGYFTTNVVSTRIPIEASGNASVSLAQDYTANIYPDITKLGNTSNIRLSDITWESVTTDNQLYSGVTSNGSMWISFTQYGELAQNETVSGSIEYGSFLPMQNDDLMTYTNFALPQSQVGLGEVYWRSSVLGGPISPMPEVGFISKTDGIKLLCDVNGAPIGFPTLPVNTPIVHRHYVNFSVSSYQTSSQIQIGLYDISTQQFIIDVDGNPQITYADYTKRGIQNIYVAVLSTFESDIQTGLPNADNSPPIPNIMIMPAYGLTTSQRTNIRLGKLSANLSKNNIWPIPVKNGSFAKTIQVQPSSSGSLTQYLSLYQGQTITAYYSIPEAKDQVWSSLYGYPNVDITKESPLVIDQYTLQIRQPSILMQRQPTIYDSLADPIRPVFTVYTRSSVTSQFEPLPWSSISDYQVSTGTIMLNSALVSLDPNLVAVDYVSTQDVYLFKEYNGSIINLNPFSGGMFTGENALIDAPVYVYILPAYITDSNGNVVPYSQQSRTLRYTLDTGIFDSSQPGYDPTAIQLGIIYVSTDFNINDLTLLDTRVLGGGGKDTQSDDALIAQNSNAINYWDVSYGAGMSYQNGCFVIVKLPAGLKSSFSDKEINDVIRRNLSAGVQFIIEDTEGNAW